MRIQLNRFVRRQLWRLYGILLQSASITWFSRPVVCQRAACLLQPGCCHKTGTRIVIQWLGSAIYPQSPLFWLLLSLIATLSLAVAQWRYRSPWVTWLWIGQWILIPYLGLIAGGLSPRLMGLAFIDWPATFGLGSGLLFVMLILLAAVRFAIAFSDASSPANHSSVRLDPATAPPDTETGVSVWRMVVWVVLLSGVEQFHWVFLRGATWEILLTAPPQLDLAAYRAIWIAAIFVILETALFRPPFDQWLIQIAALVTTSILFLYTRNFWLCWILHSATALILTANNRTQLALPGRPSAMRR